jgi:predicted flavoprotein YhiN
MEQTDRFDVAVVGAGPAGLVAATRAARRGAHVILMDRQQSPGRKIALSGGGRCNILPRAVDTNSYVTDGSRNTLRKILLSWPLPEVREFLERDAGIRLREMGAPARIYPASQSGEDVRRRLLAAAQTAGAVLRVND